MSFCSEYTVKATRKEHRCDGCLDPIAKGEPAVRWSGLTDGHFGHAVYHPDCRKAEIAYNREVLDSDPDEWMSLSDAPGYGGEDWLREKFPAVAERLCGPAKIVEPADA